MNKRGRAFQASRERILPTAFAIQRRPCRFIVESWVLYSLIVMIQTSADVGPTIDVKALADLHIIFQLEVKTGDIDGIRLIPFGVPIEVQFDVAIPRYVAGCKGDGVLSFLGPRNIGPINIFEFQRAGIDCQGNFLAVACDKFQFVVLKIQLNNPSKNRCYMEANKPCNSGFSLSFFPLADRRSHFL